MPKKKSKNLTQEEKQLLINAIYEMLDDLNPSDVHKVESIVKKLNLSQG